MSFEVVGEIEHVETVATGRALRQRARLIESYGGRAWRKMKGEATVARGQQGPRRAELHWYEAHGVGRKELKIKRYLDR